MRLIIAVKSFEGRGSLKVAKQFLGYISLNLSRKLIGIKTFLAFCNIRHFPLGGQKSIFVSLNFCE